MPGFDKQLKPIVVWQHEKWETILVLRQILSNKKKTHANIYLRPDLSYVTLLVHILRTFFEIISSGQQRVFLKFPEIESQAKKNKTKDCGNISLCPTYHSRIGVN